MPNARLFRISMSTDNVPPHTPRLRRPCMLALRRVGKNSKFVTYRRTDGRTEEMQVTALWRWRTVSSSVDMPETASC